MPIFCVNKNAQSTGEHEVHNLDIVCKYLPDPSKCISLGSHEDCRDAVAAARDRFSKVVGCACCAPGCHSR